MVTCTKLCKAHYLSSKQQRAARFHLPALTILFTIFRYRVAGRRRMVVYAIWTLLITVIGRPLCARWMELFLCNHAHVVTIRCFSVKREIKRKRKTQVLTCMYVCARKRRLTKWVAALKCTEKMWKISETQTMLHTYPERVMRNHEACTSR